MFEFGTEHKTRGVLAKLLAGFAIGAGVSFGLCGLGVLVDAGRLMDSQVLPAALATIFFFCLAGVALTLLAIVVQAIVRRFRP